MYVCTQFEQNGILHLVTSIIKHVFIYMCKKIFESSIEHELHVSEGDVYTYIYMYMYLYTLFNNVPMHIPFHLCRHANKTGMLFVYQYILYTWI